MRNYVKCCYLGMLRVIRFFEDTDEVDTRLAFEAVDREWRSLWPTGTPVPEKRFQGRPVCCTREKQRGELRRGVAPCVPMLSVFQRPVVKGPMGEVHLVGEHVAEAPYLPGGEWVDIDELPLQKAS
jgi:hypothetical protein